MSRPDDLLVAADRVAPLPRDPEGAPVFAEPWQAQAFALALALHESGLFTWSEWAEALAVEIRRGARDGRDYYRCWLGAIERLSAEKGATTSAELDDRRKAWDRAAQATPHGEAIMLERDSSRRARRSPLPEGKGQG